MYLFYNNPMNGTRKQWELDFDLPKIVPVEDIDTRGWRRISVVTERCVGNCGTCTCISDLQILAWDAAISTIGFGASWGPLLTAFQRIQLRSWKQISVPDESTDNTEVRVDIPPAPLTICSDDEL